MGLNKYFCPKCRSVVFSVEVKYEYPDLDELKKLDLMDYSNAYTWICVSLKCCGCGKKIEGIIDSETRKKALKVIESIAENSQSPVEKMGNAMWLKDYYNKHPEDKYL